VAFALKGVSLSSVTANAARSKRVTTSTNVMLKRRCIARILAA